MRSTAAGFEAWKGQFAAEAKAQGISPAPVSALMATNYATATINADRAQKSFACRLTRFLPSAARPPSSREVAH